MGVIAHRSIFIEGDYMEINEEALQRDINQFLTTYAISFGNEAANKITKLAGQAIQVFYDQYTPKYYDRYEDLLNNSYIRYYHNNGRAVYGGVAINADNMQDYRHGNQITPKEKVAEWTWTKGYHGYLNHDPNQPIYTFPPLAMLQQSISSTGFVDDICSYADKVASSKKFRVIRFD